MGYRIEKSTTPTLIFVLVDETDDETPETGLSPTVQISKAGGAFANTTNAATGISDGFYKVTLTATETNTDGALAVKVTASGADVFRDIYVVETTSTAAVSITITTDQYNAIADRVLRRSMASARASSNGDTLGARTLLGLLSQHLNRRRYDTGPAALVVYAEDDSTVFYSTPATTSTDAVNITQLNPSG